MLAVRLGTAEPVEHDVQVTKDGENKSVMNPDVICYEALGHRQDCTAYDSHIQEARPASRKRTEFRNAQAEDRGKHDRVEEPYGKDAPHRGVPASKHRSTNQRRCHNGAKSQELASLETPQKSRAEKTSDHGTSPVKRNKTCRALDG